MAAVVSGSSGAGQLQDVLWQELVDAAVILRRNCGMCWILYRRSRPVHTQLDCTDHQEPEVQQLRIEVDEWRRAIRWQPFGACFVCGLPWALCPRFEAVSNGRCRRVPGAVCHVLGLQEERISPMIVLLALVWQAAPSTYRRQLQQWIQAVPIAGNDRGAVGRWLSEKIRWEEHEASRAHQVFVWLWRGVNQQLLQDLKLHKDEDDRVVAV